jgi:hypothetical protein
METAATPALTEILEESAYLLDASRDSDDPEVREASIDLAIRSLRAAAMALGREERPAPRTGLGRVIQGPWAAAGDQSSRS